MTEYNVTWVMTIDAPNPQAAAMQADDYLMQGPQCGGWEYAVEPLDGEPVIVPGVTVDLADMHTCDRCGAQILRTEDGDWTDEEAGPCYVTADGHQPKVEVVR